MSTKKPVFIYSFKSFVKHYVSGSILLILATCLAMFMANSAFSEAYHAFCNQTISFSIGGFDILQHNGKTMTLAMLINDGLMAIFFFAVGLEIKREILVGELSLPKQAMLPIIAALGGIILPILIFKFIATDPNVANGAAIPMATDIAFSLGVLSLLGKRVPVSLKVFLTALAVADDLGGIIVIALFYSGHISPVFLYISAAVIALIIIGARSGINNITFFAVLGVLVWFLFYNSGIHPTIAGVIVAFCIPARPRIDTQKYINRIKENISEFPFLCVDKHNAVILSNTQINMLKSIESASDKVISPLQKLEDALHPVVSYFIIPIFAFVNAGISLAGVGISTLTQEATLAVMCGLILGKFFGIFCFSYAAIKTKLVFMPKGATMGGLAGIAMLGGIGFTVSIFIANLSYASIPNIGAELLNQSKLGIIVASVLAAFIGYYILFFTLRKQKH